MEQAVCDQPIIDLRGHISIIMKMKRKAQVRHWENAKKPRQSKKAKISFS
uniref:Uncharacterized protein n=1 Tax=Rhizophora mucronata TaxID=61149 RepID=A0A2P2LGC5_RHIMU